MSGRVGLLAPVLAALAVAVALVGIYLAEGGASYKPLEVADPCDPRAIEPTEGIEGQVQQLALSGLDGAACTLQVTREELVLALADPEQRERFLDEHYVSDETLESAVRAGLQRALDDAERTGAVSGIEATLLQQAIDAAPLSALVDLLQSEAGQEGLEALGGLIG
jgi:hypothetical protein